VHPICCLIVSDVRLYREGLTHWLADHDAVTVVAGTSSVRAALQFARATPPDVVLLDVTVADWISLVRGLAHDVPAVRVVAFALHDSPQIVVQCAEAGVAGYVARDGGIDELIAAIHGAVRGEAYCSPATAATLIRHVATLSASASFAGITPKPPSLTLTQRELQIVELIDRGLGNKEIAQLLNIETATVKNHVHNILDKLKVSRRGEAAATMRHAIATQGTQTFAERRQRV